MELIFIYVSKFLPKCFTSGNFTKIRFYVKAVPHFHFTIIDNGFQRYHNFTELEIIPLTKNHSAIT
ncbi:hypothetical protein ACM44_07550 [Chryseobacterium koreense CCUG 49689]|uniref:Uncharacterized protein n=1 Tax=Chryseobacterium koreense CCUG 49689 TaxID=1304281 RepID=A0A0J7IZ25_9FLAO|nr:hypothetical protein ACM44_07550 [Chryseobacterium koreense CCUG 49689]